MGFIIIDTYLSAPIFFLVNHTSLDNSDDCLRMWFSSSSKDENNSLERHRLLDSLC